MRQASESRAKWTGRRTAVAAIATAIALVPAQLAHAAERIGKKLSKKQVRAQVKSNRQVLRQRFRAHPQLPYRAKGGKVTAAPAPLRRYKPRARGDTASMSAATTCPFNPIASWGYNPNLPPDNRVSMSYGLAVTCSGGKPVKVAAQTEMVDPRGIHSEPSTGTGLNSVFLQNGMSGPKGTWTQKYAVNLSAPPGSAWKSGPPNCAGYRTPVLTCKGAAAYVT